MAIYVSRVSVLVTSRRLGSLGLASVGMIVAGMAAAACTYTGLEGEAYSPLNHFVSELGEVGVSTLAWAFNLSIVLGGLGLGTLTILLASSLRGRIRAALLVAGAIAGASGSLVGLFPMNYLAIHRIVSGVFFATGWLVAGVFSLWLLMAPRPWLPRWLLIPGAAVVAMFLAFGAVFWTYHPASPDGPIVNRPAGLWVTPSLEWASLASLLVWFTCVSIALLRRPAE